MTIADFRRIALSLEGVEETQANEDVLAGALQTAWKLRVEKNARTRKKKKAKKQSL